MQTLKTEYTERDLAYHKDCHERGGVGVVEFEIFYGDGTMASGVTEEDWKELPDDNVQFVVWRREDGSIERVNGMDDYNFLQSWKTGKWMDREEFQLLKQEVHKRSRIYNPEEVS